MDNQINKNSEDNVDMRQTYIAVSKDKPTGIKMDDFLTSNSDDADCSQDILLIEEMSKQHNQILGVIARRMNSIKSIQHYWKSGNITAGINALKMIKDLSVTMDVINAAFANG